MTSRTGPSSDTTSPVITVAVVDSGAIAPHPHLPSVAGGIAFDLDGEESDDWVDRLGHGTAAAAAIHEKAPDAELWVVKVFDRELATTVATLARAIEWASDRGLRLVNLSLGTPNDYRIRELAPVVQASVRAGTLIVSAHELDGRLWYPG
ncbi:MAG: S8 family serine peptidase, partial [Gemmatimonadota bacterium]|nr:S8 family serine peptidase [Gemmatimonadota bacterium]